MKKIDQNAYEDYKKQKVKLIVRNVKSWKDFRNKMEEHAGYLRREKKNPLKNVKNKVKQILSDDNVILTRWKENLLHETIITTNYEREEQYRIEKRY